MYNHPYGIGWKIILAVLLVVSLSECQRPKANAENNKKVAGKNINEHEILLDSVIILLLNLNNIYMLIIIFIYLEKNWIRYNISSTMTCSADFPHMVFSMQGLDGDECFIKANNHPETKFVFWKDVEFLNGTWEKSRCEFFEQCNKKRNLTSTWTPGYTYQIGNGKGCSKPAHK